jgi:hypothetical protein
MAGGAAAPATTVPSANAPNIIRQPRLLPLPEIMICLQFNRKGAMPFINNMGADQGKKEAFQRYCEELTE